MYARVGRRNSDIVFFWNSNVVGQMAGWAEPFIYSKRLDGCHKLGVVPRQKGNVPKCE